MRLRRNFSLYWRLLASYLLVILVGCVTLYLAGDAFAPFFFEQHMGGMMTQMSGMDRMMGSMVADLNEAYQRATQQAMVWGLSVSALIAGAVGLFVTGRIVTPLKRMQQASQRIASGQYQNRLNTKAPGEIGELAHAFNEMASALEHIEGRRIELLGNVAHELKTPLSSLHGYIDGLADGVFQPDAETLGACKRQITRLERLVEDLSLLSRVETGQESLHPRLTEAATLLESVATAFRPQSREKGVDLVLAPTSVNLTVFADPQRTGQVLTNLVANSLRHTPAGGEVSLSAQASKSGEVLFRVADTGEGIPLEDLPHIFTRFYRVDKARTRDENSGSGIGLTIAKRFVEMQGGRIGVESQPGRGSSFWFTLPIAPVNVHDARKHVEKVPQ